MRFVAVHGGVSGIAQDPLPPLAHALPPALGPRRALDAVEAAVRVLEDDPGLNAGLGAVLNRAGELELDAGIVDGPTGRVGGVANVDVRHPISLARRVLEHTPHVLLAGAGASRLASDMEALSDTTPEQRQRYADARAAGELTLDNYARPDHVDTVGAVALDAGGALAAGCSTGGVFGKLPGRIGDSPVFGAGLYASRVAAVVGTGVGELFLETLACLRAGELIEGGSDPRAACEAVVGSLGARADVSAGILALDRTGRVGAAFRGGSWAVEGPDGPIAATRISA